MCGFSWEHMLLNLSCNKITLNTKNAFSTFLQTYHVAKTFYGAYQSFRKGQTLRKQVTGVWVLLQNEWYITIIPYRSLPPYRSPLDFRYFEITEKRWLDMMRKFRLEFFWKTHKPNLENFLRMNLYINTRRQHYLHIFHPKFQKTRLCLWMETVIERNCWL